MWATMTKNAHDPWGLHKFRIGCSRRGTVALSIRLRGGASDAVIVETVKN
jgi:hypothetical protein